MSKTLEEQAFENFRHIKYKLETINGTEQREELLKLLEDTRRLVSSFVGYLCLPRDLQIEMQIGYIENEVNCCSPTEDSDEEDILIGILKTLQERQDANNT